MPKFCEMGALWRVFKLGEIHAKAEEMVEKANTFQVDLVVLGIQDFFREEGVPEGEFINSLKAKAKAKKDKQTEIIRSLKF